MNGDDLEKETKDILVKDGWNVSAGVYYKDPSTKKPREKDIIATFPQYKKGEEILHYNVRLFIECKCLQGETELYPKSVSMDEIEETLLCSNISFADISEIERHKEFHFYNNTKVFSDKDGKDFLHKAINQNLQSLDAFRKNNNESAIYYLVVVYDGKLKFVDENKKSKYCSNALVIIETIDDIFNLSQKQCFIDLVSIDQFKGFLEDIKKDIGKINFSNQFYFEMEKNKIDENRRIIKDKKIDYGL